MRFPQVSERVKEAPAHALRAVFASIGQVLLVTDRMKNKPAEEETPAAPAAETPAAPAARRNTGSARGGNTGSARSRGTGSARSRGTGSARSGTTGKAHGGTSRRRACRRRGR